MTGLVHHEAMEIGFAADGMTIDGNQNVALAQASMEEDAVGGNSADCQSTISERTEVDVSTEVIPIVATATIAISIASITIHAVLHITALLGGLISGRVLTHVAISSFAPAVRRLALVRLAAIILLRGSVAVLRGPILPSGRRQRPLRIGGLVL
jgi:hypothetical protein